MIRLLRRSKRWLKRHPQIIRDASVGMAVFAVVVTLVQIVYPSGRLLPFVEVQGFTIGGQQRAVAETALQKRYAQAGIVVQAGEKKIEASFAQIGVDVDQTASVRAAAKYPLYQRFVPFSSFAIMLGRDTPLEVRYDDERLRYFAQQVAKQAHVPAVNAGVAITNGKVALVPARPAQEYPADSVIKTLRSAAWVPKTKLALRAVAKPAQRTDNEVRGVLGEAQRAVNAPLVLTLNGKSTAVSKATIGTWLDFTEDASGNLQLSLKKDAAKTYLEQMQAKIYKAPGTTKIQLLDGQEIGRTTGETGRGIAFDQALERLNTAIHRSGRRTVDVPIAELPAKIVYERKTSSTSAGLAVLLKDIVTAKGNYAIAVMEINGRSASANGNKQFTSASTFKLFVAYAALKAIEAGSISWSDTMYGSKNASTCFDDMIVVSDNPCANAFGDKIGWSTIDTMMKGLGLTSTQVIKGNHLTTANDLALFLYKLEKGTLLPSADRIRLLNDMKKQIYRSGIPAGTGVTVADKVGFLDGLLHDAGVVYGPKGPYVLVVLSDGSSWTQLADAAKQIHNFLKQ